MARDMMMPEGMEDLEQQMARPKAAKAQTRGEPAETGIARALSNPGASKRSATATAKLTANLAKKKPRRPRKPRKAY